MREAGNGLPFHLCCGGVTVAGQVLDISKHDNTARKAPVKLAGKRARLYPFPAPAAVAEPPVSAVEQPEPLPRSRFRLHLAVELGVGLFLWLLWYAWHLLH